MSVAFRSADADSRRAGRFRLSLALALLSAPLLLAGCEQSTTYPAHEGERELVLHGVLIANKPEQEILVEYTRLMNDGFFRGITPASGADVMVTGSETYRFIEDPEQPGVYRASFIPQAGAQYALRIRGPQDELVTAATMVPGAPRLIMPANDTVVKRNLDIPLYWTHVPTARAYMGLDVTFFPTEDTTATVRLGLMREMEVRLAIAAVDSNVFEYFFNRGGGAGPQYRFRSTVQGGWGLFGSAAVSEPRLITFEK